MNIGWPEGIYLVILLIGFGWKVAKHGEPQDDHNWWASSIASVIVLSLLWWGGFFS